MHIQGPMLHMRFFLPIDDIALLSYTWDNIIALLGEEKKSFLEGQV